MFRDYQLLKTLRAGGALFCHPASAEPFQATRNKKPRTFGGVYCTELVTMLRDDSPYQHNRLSSPNQYR